MRKFIALFLALATVLLFPMLAACNCTGTQTDGNDNTGNSGAAAQNINLTLWGAADDQQMLKDMVDEFIRGNPDRNYSIEVRVNGEDTARDEALKDIESAADVFAITNDQLGALVNAGAVYENTRYTDEIKRTVTESAFNAASVDGKLYGYPSSSETYFLFFDKSKLNEDDVKSLEAILAKKQDNDVAEFAMDFGDAYFSSLFFLTAGCDIYGDSGEDPGDVDFDSDDGIAAAEYIASLKDLGAEDISGDAAASRFKSGKLAAYISGSWKTDSFADALGSNLGVAKLPTIKINGEERNMISFAGGKMYVVNATTKHPLEAMALAAFLTNEDNQLKRFNERAILPCNINLIQRESVKARPSISAELRQLEHSIATPSIPQMSRYWDPVAAFTKDAFDGKIPKEQIPEKLKQLVSDITVSR